MEHAERIKKDLGTVLIERIREGETAEVPGMGTRPARPVPRTAVCEILRDRAVELLELVKDQIWKAVQNERLIAGAVITGGGSMLDGMVELAEETLGMPVRQGLPMGVRGLTEELSHPVYATAIGLALCAAQEAGLRNKSRQKASSSPWPFSRILQWAGN
jgi:cell division protein FtsA